MNPEFWSGKKVFITGHTGFKGSWLSLWLQLLGAEVTGFALPSPTTPSFFELGKIDQQMHSIIGDIRNLHQLSTALNEAKPDIVIHLAAQSLVRKSYFDPVDTFSTNIMGTVNLFEAIRSCNSVIVALNVTTDKCYENKEWLWGYRENEALGGFDPYSSSKACSELITSAYRNSYFKDKKQIGSSVAIATARAGNVIGGGDWAEDRLIPDLLRSFTNNEIAHIRYPNAVRPWQHVLDPLNGYLTLLEKLFEDGQKYAESWNFGPSEEDSQAVVCIAEKLCHLWGEGAKWKVSISEHPHEASALKLDTSKSRAFLNWRPNLNLEDSLKLVVDWTKNFHLGRDVRQFTLEQISDYQKSFISLE